MTGSIRTRCRAAFQEAPGRWRLTRHADVVAALADARLDVPPPGDEAGPMAEFRRSVSRFCDGAEHPARRAAVAGALKPVDVEALRAETRDRMSVLMDRLRGDRVDLVPLLRTVPVGVLAEALGVPGERSRTVAGQVATVARAYPPGAAAEAVADADRAIVRLTELLGPDRLAVLGCVLVQACEATAGLIANTLRGLPAPGVSERPDPEVALARTLRLDPPVRATSRVALSPLVAGGRPVAAGSTVLLDLAAAAGDGESRGPDGPETGHAAPRSLVSFGSGPRRCPGEEAALALAAGAVEATSHCVLTEVAYGPPGNLRVPTRLEVIA
jgi:cytochrome P450